MSRIGKMPILIPMQVSVIIKEQKLIVEGILGVLKMEINPLIYVSINNNIINVKKKKITNKSKCMHGTTRSLILNMIHGVSKGFTKTLQIIGVGYKAELSEKNLKLSLGFSHIINYVLPKIIQAKLNYKKTQIVLNSIDKQLLGETAAKIRSFRPPEPYKGKGIKYAEEIIRRKEGKSATK